MRLLAKERISDAQGSDLEQQRFSESASLFSRGLVCVILPRTLALR
jgi:hypothetical protein